LRSAAAALRAAHFARLAQTSDRPRSSRPLRAADPSSAVEAATDNDSCEAILRDAAGRAAPPSPLSTEPRKTARDHDQDGKTMDQTDSRPPAQPPRPARDRRSANDTIPSRPATPLSARTEEGSARPAAEGEERTRGTLRTLPETFLDERDDVLSVINELEDQLDRYEDIRESLEKELTGSTQQLQAAQQRVQELEWQIVSLQARVEASEQVRQEVTLLEEEIADANQRAQRLTEQLAEAEKENGRLNSELKAAGKQLEELWLIRKERDGLRADSKTLRSKLDQLERAQRELIEERTALLARFQETQAALDETRSVRAQLEAELRASEDRNQELRRVQAVLEEKLEALRVEKRTLQAQLTKLERENSRLVEQQHFFECELTSLRSMNRSAESALSNVKRAFNEVRTALSETKARARRRTIDTWPTRIQTALRVADSTGSGPDVPAGRATAGIDEGDSGDAEDPRGASAELSIANDE
jgi:predicted  nucleic acid-binding Zn-ribbon protein